MRLWLPALVAVLLLGSGCRSEPDRSTVAAAPVKKKTTKKKKARTPKKAVAPVERPAGAPAAVSPAAPADAVRAELDAAAAKTPEPELVRAVYAAMGGAPLFHKGLDPTDRARQLAALVVDLETHGLEREPYGLTAVAIEPARTPADAAALDAKLVWAMTKYVLDFRFWKVAHPFAFWKTPAEHLVKRRKAIVAAVSVAALDVESGLKALWPRHPSYELTRKALAHYRALALLDVPAIPKVRRLDAGAHGPVVTTLQKRLALEGYLVGQPTGVMDEATLAAVSEYQSTHQLETDGRIGKATIQSLNVPMSRRVAQLELSLQRWRESYAPRDGKRDFVRVNIAAFGLELFEGGQRTREHRIIVGQNALDADLGAWVQGHLNRTKLFRTRIYEIQLNPTWLVPKRIRDMEVDPAASKDPGHFGKKGYREITLSDGTKVLQQGAGKQNALGRAKFLLEKTDAIYLHDTDKPWLFKQLVRDFSHGCMRVDEALDLARHVAIRYGKITSERFDAMLESGRTQPIALGEGLPLFIEYNTVDFDEQGRVVFLNDVYEYDEAFFKGKLPPAVSTWYGSRLLHPAKAPVIPFQEYKRLKAKGGLAPLSWPRAHDG